MDDIFIYPIACIGGINSGMILFLVVDHIIATVTFVNQFDTSKLQWIINIISVENVSANRSDIYFSFKNGLIAIFSDLINLIYNVTGI
ncbi:41803_t:CDS:2 [Gigaspora margarita]|uniref:41803_t:CDS:1 n=1 Tax=Gigaspora margarita TaxID=4874 RepID=A0ABN7UP44_GIGMA|nr:41803_t:CDS:2 [Gigaspora margarita]